MLSAVELLPTGLLGRIADCLEVQDCVRLALVSRCLLQFLQNDWAPKSLSFDYALRQRIRRQTFIDNQYTSLPSHFTHIFNINNESDGAKRNELNQLLRNLLVRRRGLHEFRHIRSPKTLKLHHPYFYRQLPLALKNGRELPAATLCPDDIPLPHDLSLVDLTHILMLNHTSLEKVDIATFDSSPLPWNSTPSRVCPRDVLTRCLYEPSAGSNEPLNPTVVCVWCPDCKPAQHEHSICWRVAGEALINQLTSVMDRKSPDSQDARFIAEGSQPKSVDPLVLSGVPIHGCSIISSGCLSFPKLKSLKFRGWAVTNFMSILRVLNCHSFPVLENLSLGGTVIMAPSLTDSKDASPRPALHLTRPTHPHTHSRAVQWPGKDADLCQKFMQLLSFHYSPFARRYNEKSEEEYWMGLFNGVLWNRETFPQLKSLSFRVGNFDDACRWITPAMQNCFSFCPRLETIELDHSIVQTLRAEDPIIKLFSLIRDRQPADAQGIFPALRFVKLRILNGPFELARLQEVLTDLFGRLIIVKVRKLFLRLSSRLARDEAALIRNWTKLQRERIHLYLAAHPRATDRDRLASLSDEELSIFSSTTDGSPMLIITFDSHHPGDEEVADQNHAETVSAANPFYYGDEVLKVLLKHLTPTSPTHQQMLEGIRFTCPSDSKIQRGDNWDDECLQLCSTTDGDEAEETHRLKRLTVQLDLPQVWQVTEEEAKAAVTSEVETLRDLLLNHPDLSQAGEARVTSCTRLTYGGSNWTWWEQLICGKVRRQEKNLQVDGWARESKDVINGDQLKVYKCSHVWSADAP